jgi:multidrug efflux pump subunit AcrA (membrane-fusion protein)
MERDTDIVEKKPVWFFNLKTFFSKHKKATIIVIILLVIIFIARQLFAPKQTQQQYQTATVTKDTIISTLGESGTVAVSNRVAITTQASGLVKTVNVKNGDTVSAGDTIATIDLDRSGQQQQSQAWASYLSAKNTLASAHANMFSLQSSMFTAWNNYVNLATNGTYQNGDGSPNIANRTLPAFTTLQDNWYAAQAAYQNQQGVVAQAQTALNTAWLSYQLSSATITAPMSGTISDIILAPGMQVVGSANTSSSSTSNSSSVTVATIKNSGNPVITVSLSEVALPNQTFTGKVLGVNTTGSVSSGVSTYPATIQLDVPNDAILPNMSATANIITAVKADVLSVPTSAIQTTNEQSVVHVLKNGQVTSVPVETGISSDTNTEITSGLTEGQTVITNYVATGNATTSPFSSGLRIGGLGGGNATRGGR